MESARLWVLGVLVLRHPHSHSGVLPQNLEALDDLVHTFVVQPSCHGFFFLYIQAAEHRHCLHQMDRDRAGHTASQEE